MIEINLLPWREQLREERKQHFLIALGATGACALVMLVLAHFFVDYVINQQHERNAFLRNEITLLDKQIAEIKHLKKLKEALIARMNVIQTLQSSRAQVVHLFNEVVDVLPKGVHLTKVARNGGLVTLTGMAESNTNVSNLMREIEGSAWLTHSQLSEIKRTQKGNTTSFAFNINMNLTHPEKNKGS